MFRSLSRRAPSAWRSLNAPLAATVLAVACTDGSTPVAPTAPTAAAAARATGGVTIVSVVGLEPLVGALHNDSRAFDVDDAGRVVGTSITPLGDSHAVLWDNSPYPIDLGTLDGPSHAYAIKSDGSVIVGFAADNTDTRAVRWIKPGGSWVLDPLSPFPGSTDCMARDIADDGTIVGFCDFAGVAHAIAWRNGVASDLGPGPAFAANAFGQVVGANGPYWNEPVLWSLSDGSGTPLSPPGMSHGPYDAALGIDASGSVVGRATFGGVIHAFLWTAKKGMVDLGGGLGAGPSSAYAVNGSMIVGSSDLGVWDGHAILWTKGKVVNLGDLDGYTNSEARGVNGKGQIVGTSVAAIGGSARATMWTVK